LLTVGPFAADSFTAGWFVVGSLVVGSFVAGWFAAGSFAVEGPVPAAGRSVVPGLDAPSGPLGAVDRAPAEAPAGVRPLATPGSASAGAGCPIGSCVVGAFLAGLLPNILLDAVGSGGAPAS
jgi:hypothetical protein